MSRGKHTEAQMIEALKQVEAGRSVEDVGRQYGVSKHTIYGWKAKYGGLDASEAQEMKQLRDENARLKKLVADLSLDKDMQHDGAEGGARHAAVADPKKIPETRSQTSGSAAAESGVCDQRAARLRAHEYSAIEQPVSKPAGR